MQRRKSPAFTFEMRAFTHLGIEFSLDARVFQAVAHDNLGLRAKFPENIVSK
jgi:hypothetical protein